MDAMKIPRQLRELCQWVVWKYVGTELRKVPFQPNGQPAKSNDPDTWHDIDSCLEVVNDYSGLGFVFGADGDLWGIDLDGCIENGEISEWALEIINRFPTYAEISPSGNGIKIFGRGGKLPATGKKKLIVAPEVGGRKPAIEVYSRGRYFTVTGDRIGDAEVADCAEEIESLVRELWPEPQANYSGKPNGSMCRPQTGIEERATAYLQAYPAAISGQGGHNVTFRAACVLVLGFGLTIDAAFPILAEWNARCDPPWSEKELLHKLQSADSQPGPRGYLLDERPGFVAAEEDSGVDLSGLTECKTVIVPLDSSVSAEAIPAAPQQPVAKRVPRELLAVEGFIDAVVQHNLATARCPQPELAFCGALALLATITGRKIQDYSGTRTNIYVICPAPSGSGKEHARQLNKTLLSMAGHAGDKMIGPEGIGSHAGLVSYLAENPAALFQVDEFADFLEAAADLKKSPHLALVITKLLSLYTSAGSLWISDALADLKKVKRINQPHCVLYGTCTPDNFWASINSRSLNGGFIGRLISLEAGYSDQYRPVDRCDPPQALIEWVRWWLRFNEADETDGNLCGTMLPRKQIVIPHTFDARYRIESQAREISTRLRNDDPTTAAIWSRSTERVSKLALLFAVSRMGLGNETTCIEIDDAERAIALSNYITRHILRQAEDRVSENDWEAKKKRVLRLVGDGGITGSVLTRKTQFLKSKERQDVLRELYEAGELSIEQVAGTTKPTTIIRRVK